MPSPKLVPAVSLEPCQKTVSDVGRSPEEVSRRLSAPRLGEPVAASSAPPVPIEFSQPWPAMPLLPHGQGAPDPSPKQKLVTGEGPPPPGTSPEPATEPGAPDFHTPSAIEPDCGPTSASKRKLYCVPQRIALAEAFCACVSHAQSTELAARVPTQAAPLKFTLPVP